MPTRSSKEYHLGETSDTLSFNTTSSNPEKPNTSLNPRLLAILEDIRGQVAKLGQMMDRTENERRDRDRNEDRQPTSREDRINRNYDRYEDDECYLEKNHIRSVEL